MRLKSMVLCVTACIAAPVFANDSSSAIGIGGLELTQNNAVSMDSEDLYLSMDKVVVKYRFTNTSAQDVETLVSFPLPPLPGGISGYLGDQDYPNWNDFSFQTLVDGKSVTYSRIVKIEANGKDVSARLKELDWQIDYWTNSDRDDMFTKIQKLSPEQRAAYIKEGLLKPRMNDLRYIDPNWQSTTYITRKQIFPARKTISVEHSYVPLTGGSVGGMMEKSNRKDSYFKEYVANFCIDKSFITAFDKRRYSGKKNAEGNEPGSFYSESWLDYVLKSGANWKGPIKNLRLVVDKGRADNLVSFCMDGVKKISPTQFEVRKTNFEPTKDINILIVQWAPA
jgi:Domain of unknown function (DUF4424)